MSLAIALIGFTSLVSQVVLLRELFVVFYGNELSVGAILAAWLFWVAVGSGILPRFFRNQVSILQAATVLILPLELFFVANIRTLAGAIPGEIIGFYPMLLWSSLTLAPLCLLLGWQFSAACDAAAPRYTAGQVYLFESLGAVAGGLLSSFVLLYYFNAWQIALGLAWLNLLSAVVLLGRGRARTSAEAKWERGRQGERERMKFFLSIPPSPTLPFILLLALLLVPLAATALRDLSLKQLWQGYNLVESRDSIYGNIAVTARGTQFSFFENGLLLATTEDYLVAEETAHYPLLQHPQPKRVLLIGGGINGTVREILNHPVERVDYVELDPAIIDTARRYLPPIDPSSFDYRSGGSGASLDDARVTIHHLDGRLFVRQQGARGEKYDVVLMNAPHPFTAQVNRLYTVEFFTQVYRILREDGLFAFVFLSAENAPSREVLALDASVYRALRAVFADVLIMPGDDALLIASLQTDVLTRDAQTLGRRWNQRELQTAILTPSHLDLRLTPNRLAYAQQVFDRAVPPNRDLEPLGLYFDLMLWASYFSFQLRDAMGALFQWRAFWFAPLLIVLVVAAISLGRAKSRRHSAMVWMLAALGFAGMVWEVSLVFAFQVLHGYVYHQIALLMTAFMVGLVLGSAWGTRISGDHTGSPLRVIVGAAVVYSLLLPLALQSLQLIEATFAAQIVVPILLGVGGLLVGAAFPLTTSPPTPVAPSPLSRQSLAGEGGGGEVGTLYAADLAGAGIGAVLAGAFLIPVLGLTTTTLIAALVNMSALAFLVVARD
jgi:spermidine synthase